VLLDRLRRVTRDGRWIPEIDGLRFVAIGSVVLFHLRGELMVGSGRTIPVEPNYWWLDRLLANGDRGVSLFFVISGMILALPYARHLLLGSKPVSLRKYYMRRVTRLEPPYIVSLVVVSAGYFLYWHRFAPGFAAHALASAFYQHSLVFGQMSWVNPAAWSLEVEIQFYALAPLVMQCYRIRGKGPRRALLLVSVLCISLIQIPFQTWPRVDLSILFYLQYFLMGLLVADVFVLDLEKMKSSWAWDIAGAVALGAIFFSPRTTDWPHALMPIPIGVLCVAAMRSYALRLVLANQWVAVIGGMCYSIYLLHWQVIAAIWKVTRHAVQPGSLFITNFTIQLLLVTVPLVTTCAIFFLLVERPCMDPNWPSKLWHKLTGRRQDEVAVLDAAGISE